MNIVFFSHPLFLGHKSMQRYTNMLAEGMKKRGHKVEVWSPASKISKISNFKPLKKWLGYIDQYIIFPIKIKKRLISCRENTLFVFTDHALGPWVPQVSDRPHIVHCHDFLAQRSALGEFPQNRTSWTGYKYQSFIRRGYSNAKHFISVSGKTRKDLHRFLTVKPITSEVVYNGLSDVYFRVQTQEARAILKRELDLDLSRGYLLHVGGNQWYKNRLSVVRIYDTFCLNYKSNLPLLLIGEVPNESLLNVINLSPNRTNIYPLSNLSDESIRLAYCGASVLLFPSIAEGFGWPIAEAMACGCPVITTNEAPMTEVAGNAAFLIDQCPLNKTDLVNWTIEASKMINQVLMLSNFDKDAFVQAGLLNVERFDLNLVLNEIEGIYLKVLEEFAKRD